MTGPIEAKVRQDVEALFTAHPMGEGLAELAFSVARVLDGDDVGGMPRAALTRELRQTLEVLASMREADDDGFDDELSTPSMPTEILDPEDPGTPDFG